MTTNGPGPTTIRRRIRLLLRQLRADRGHSQEDVCRVMAWSQSKMARIERGTTNIPVRDLRDLLEFYEIDDADEVRRLLDLAKLARRPHWAGAYRDSVPAPYMDFLGYEDDALRISQYHPFVIPGLLQTEQYARLLVAVGPRRRDGDDEAEARVRLRLARQRRVFAQPPRPGRVRIVLDERALTVVESDQVKLDQIEMILSRLPDIDFALLRRDTATDSVLVGPFSLHEFGSEADPDVVYVASQPEDVALIEDPEVVAGYKRAFDDLYHQAASGDEARHILDTIATSLRGTSA
ncbi:helix-turn-helix domain-containing protein [Micromonospora craniellae]|uniref:XRE family transcriptional regulator n=1 Tax=Micromonospora craniellae TaxID=2294034 RepID=A0A372FVA7_9ACTN|nr:helix-turn-helix transcriptional regulator [Micromonospora craniellae]QOC95085.1 helix-turn-helix domain-containing protein [Micromonospora craniellae]RFS44554.1 XRE family transcriptional regulator [Micromonospora craniellae]